MPQTITLSQEQATIIASAILPDIRKYIAEHQTEYEEYLKHWNEQQTALKS